MLILVRQEVMVEFGALKLAFEWPGGTCVRFRREAVVRRGDRFRNLFRSIHRPFIREALLRIVGGLHSVFSAGRSESCWFVLRWRWLRLGQGGILEI